MDPTKKKIIEGIKLLNEECKKIPQEKCHSDCPYEKICLTMRCVGWETIIAHRTPDMWAMKILEEEDI